MVGLLLESYVEVSDATDCFFFRRFWSHSWDSRNQYHDRSSSNSKDIGQDAYPPKLKNSKFKNQQEAVSIHDVLSLFLNF